MKLNQETLLARIAELKEMGQRAAQSETGSRGILEVDAGLARGFRTAALSFIAKVFGADHSHYQEFDRACSGRWPSDVAQGLAIIDVLRSEIEQGWLTTFGALVAAELFGSFIEMAQHLLAEGYQHAAAVMAGGVLEGHLRRLCEANGIDTYTEKSGAKVPKKADLMNAELAKAGVYTSIDQKLVTGWLGIRNAAAHGKYDEYDQAQVKNMIDGILSFMGKF